MSDSQQLRTANAEALQARYQMLATFEQVKRRMRPANLADEARGKIRDKTEIAVATGARALSRHPVLLLGMATVAVLFLSKRSRRGSRAKAA
ncbi:hypothetical protein [Stakelama marina]|uniref:DUF3618 domain-containing protein n=1 Tax=Stakelama marina TaxID=2826939 RepID=A0A8T4IAC3_9SPHN|nr:hypothetical protein [Stakelama marina]MBR0551500.1 hypothetical protein [Stakelama marina]